MTTIFTVIEWRYTEGDSDDGPLTDEFHVVSLVQGDLADKIRTKVGVGPEALVCIIEDAVDASYSEYTRGSDYSFTLTVDGDAVDFGSRTWDGGSGIGALMDWLDEDDDAPEVQCVINTYKAISPSAR